MAIRSFHGSGHTASVASTSSVRGTNHTLALYCNVTYRFTCGNQSWPTFVHSLTNQRTGSCCGRVSRPVNTFASTATYTSNAVTTESASADLDEATAIADAAAAESLQILEWPAICKQVACFCGTSVATELIASGKLPRGHSRKESEKLLQQTAEAIEAGLEVQGCFDIRPAVQAAAAGVCLNAKQFEGVATTLEAAFALKARVSESLAGGLRFPSLAALAAGIDDEERTLLRAIRACIQLGSVSDAASEALAAVRAERQANKEALRAEVEGWARQLRAKGAAEAGAVALVRGRFCVGVKAGRQGDLPKGSVRLSASSTGATLYMEPKPAVELNNREALLAEQEQAEEIRVLSLLSRMLGTRVPQLGSLVGAFTALDVVAARARHAKWLGGTRPAFIDTNASESSSLSAPSPLFMPGALHPVLMQRALPPLPQPPSIDDNRFDRDFQAAPAWELRRVLRPEGPQSGESPPEAVAGSGPGSSASSLMPRPLDLRVPSGRAVVAITGPNTGGKTVTLKAAGLMVLMAQAGLYLPCQPEHLATHGPPTLAWFDRVLADIGDAQSLQQNLSTFSGHIRRIKQILAAAGGRSLVLLDEVGSGTDPLEGAALARAVLDRLANQAHLTLATTHHAELKRASEEDPRYVNVSMAFDTATLRPTYSLCWGAAGASNALDIAETLGFDRSVVLEARCVARVMAESAEAAMGAPASGSDSGRESRLAGVAASLVAQLEETREELEAQRMAKARRMEVLERVKETTEQVRDMEAQLKMSPKEIVQERDVLAAEVQSALDAFAAGLQAQAPVEEALSRIEALIPDQVAAFRRSGLAGAADAGEEDALQPGDRVFVPSYGDFGNGKVISVKGDEVRVALDVNTQMPFMGGRPKGAKAIKLQRREVQKLAASGASVAVGVHTGWSSQFPSLAEDIRRVLGEVSEEERAAAARAAARRAAAQSARQLEMAAGVSYEDLFGEVVAKAEADLEQQQDDEWYQEDDLSDFIEALDEYGSDGDDSEEYGQARGRGPAQRGGGRGAANKKDAVSATVADGGNGTGARQGGSGREREGFKAAGSSRSPAAAAAAAAAGAPGGPATTTPPAQTAENTLDVGGAVPELAAAEVEDYLRDAAPGAVFYVRHGVGTGAVRSAVFDVLRRRGPPRGRVREWREAPNSRGEVTVVFLS